MENELDHLIFFQRIVAFLSIGTGIFVFLFFVFRNSKNERLKIYTLLFVFSGVVIDITLHLVQMTFTLNNFLFNCYTFLSAVFVSLIFNELKVNELFNRLNRLVFSIFLFGVVLYSFFKNSFSFDNSIMHVVLSFLILFFTLYYFFWKYNSVGTELLTNESNFWFFTALFIYFGVPLVITMTKNLLGSIDPVAFGYLWQIMNLSTVIFHLLIVRMLWLMRIA